MTDDHAPAPAVGAAPDFPPEADFSDLETVAQGLATAVPESEPIRPLALLGAGYYSVAVETCSGFVFRLGCTEEVTTRHDKEARLLPWLKPRLPVAIPEPLWRITPCAAFPYGAIGYRKLEGKILSPDRLKKMDRKRIAQDLASCIYALHNVPPEQAQRLGASAPEEGDAYLHRLRRNVLPVLAARLPAECYESVARWWEDFFSDPSMREFTPVLTHGDLSDENMLVDEKGERLIGVLDWEHAAVGDPALDFIQFRFVGRGFQEEALGAYESLGGRFEGDVQHRLYRYWQLGAFYGVQMASRRQDEALLGTYIEGVRRRGFSGY